LALSLDFAVLILRIVLGHVVNKHLASDADNEHGMIDATIVRAHQHSGGAVKKRTKIKLSDVAEVV
jgi:hypothetical protein